MADGVFIGSNTSLVAPITLGEGAYTGAGSVITKNVPKDSLAIGRARQSKPIKKKKQTALQKIQKELDKLAALHAKEEAIVEKIEEIISEEEE